MSREIKFRGKRVDIGTWVYGFLEYVDLERKMAWIRGQKGTGSWEYAVDPETVGQYTGLKDKNGKGKEVYKDDVCSSFNGVKYLVFWNQKRGQWYGRIINKTKGVHVMQLHEILNNNYMKIIGNIHESPDLMEKAK